MASPDDVDARGTLLYGAYLSGVALGTTSTGLHHKLCHVLGGTLQPGARRRPLGDPAARDRVQRARRCRTRWPGSPTALGVPGGDPAAALWDLAVASNVPTRLADLKGDDGLLQRDDLPGARTRRRRRSPSTRARSTRPTCSAYSNAPTKENDHEQRSVHRRCSAHTARSYRWRAWRVFAPTTCWPVRCAPSSSGRRRSTRRRSTRSTPATPTAPAKTTATSAAWRCCSPACRRRSRRQRSTGCAAVASRRSSAPRAPSPSATPTSPSPVVSRA